MSIIIRKKDTGEVFDVLPGFKLEVKNTSPIFNDLGSKTVATSLPKTPNNSRLLSFANRIDIKNKPRFKMPVLVSSGSYMREGMLYLSSAYNSENTFGITIAFNEGIMYENMTDILLSDLSSLPVERKPISEFEDYFNELLTGKQMDDPLSIFRVCLKETTYTTEHSTESTNAEILNSTSYASDGNVKLDFPTSTYVIHDSKLVEIPVPYGYGITPFVKVWYVLEAIFKHFGYAIGQNPFKEHYQLKRLCVLNNLVGAIMEGILDYKQLLPKVSIKDFLQSLYARFGLKVFFNSNTNEVNLILLRDTFQNNDYRKMYLASYPDIDYSTPKQVKLSAAKNLEKSSSETDTYEEFLSKYNNIIGIYPGDDIWIKAGGVYYNAFTGLFHQMSTTNRNKKIMSSIHFDWNKKDENIEVEEITGTDECITMLSWSRYMPYFAVDPDLANLVLEIDGLESTTSENKTLAFAYDMGDTYTDNPDDRSISYGSIFPYSPLTDYNKQELLNDKDGNQMQYALTFVGEYGAFNQFFKEYDAFLRHSNHLVKFKSHTTIYELSDIRFDQKVIIGNHPLLLDKVDHDLGDNRMVATPQIEARTTRLYEPYNLDTEQALPVPEDIRYQWVLNDNQEQSIGDERKDVKAGLPQNNSLYHFVSLSDGEVTDDPNPPDETTFWFLPPTEYQYIHQAKVGERNHTCKVRFIHYYKIAEGDIGNTHWVDKSEVINKDVNYRSWFEPDPIEK